MKFLRRFTMTLFTLALCVGLFLPLPVSAADLYFTAINERIEYLTSDTMPFWSGGTLYVPYTLFDKNLNSTQTDLGITVSYNSRTKTSVTLYNLRQQMLTFDLVSGNCRDELTGEVFSYRAVMRNGKPYLPLEMVCSFFGLSWSYNALPEIPQSYLVRIMTDDVVLDDATFIGSAGYLLERRLQAYTQSLSPGETTTTPGTSAVPGQEIGKEEEVTSTNIPTYLAIRCESGDSILSILNTLDTAGRYGAFFLTPELLESQGDLVRRMLGTGHSVGILALGETQEETAQLLEQGQYALEQLALTRTTLAYVPQDQMDAMEQKGWVCWDETLLLTPSSTVSISSYCSRIMNRLEGRNLVTYLTLSSDADGARVLSTLLRQLSEEHFVVGTPLETRL